MSQATTSWRVPLPLELVPTNDTLSFRGHGPRETGLPLPPHPGAFGVQRRHHVHEGVDLYAPEGTPVLAVERGIVVAVAPFTGPSAGLPWWLDTEVVLVEGESGVVAYGELKSEVRLGDKLDAGDRLGCIQRVLRNDKGRPTSMLHLELHIAGTRVCSAWETAAARPASLLDPTPQLLRACSRCLARET